MRRTLDGDTNDRSVSPSEALTAPGHQAGACGVGLDRERSALKDRADPDDLVTWGRERGPSSSIGLPLAQLGGSTRVRPVISYSIAILILLPDLLGGSSGGRVRRLSTIASFDHRRASPHRDSGAHHREKNFSPRKPRFRARHSSTQKRSEFGRRRRCESSPSIPSAVPMTMTAYGVAAHPMRLPGTCAPVCRLPGNGSPLWCVRSVDDALAL